METAISLNTLYTEHHSLLRLSWRIRQGQEKGIDVDRIGSYIQYIWTTSLKPHFEIEELHIFPILGSESALVQRALNEHRWIQRLILNQNYYSVKTLNRIEERLERHIRFEEKNLFPAFQKLVSKEQSEWLASLYDSSCKTLEWDDQFWM